MNLANTQIRLKSVEQLKGTVPSPWDGFLAWSNLSKLEREDRFLGMDSWESIPGLKSLQIRAQSWVFKHSVGARSWVVIGLLYRPARLHRADGIDSWALQKFRISGSAGWRIGPFELTGSTCILHTIFTSSCRLLDRDRLTRLNWTNLTVYSSFICTFKWIFIIYLPRVLCLSYSCLSSCHIPVILS
jgi:hypothetical protein